MPASMPHRSHSPRLAHAGGAGGHGSARVKILLAALVLVAAVVALYYSDFSWQEIPGFLERVNRPMALLLMATLPIVGFPISAVYLAAGALFGPWVGGVVVMGVTTVHLLATHAVARTPLLRDRVARLRRKWNHLVPQLPHGEYGALIAMVAIVPGPPYFARNCILVLSGAPLRMLLGVGVPVYVARSYVTIFLGDLGNDPSPRALAILGAVFATKLAISALLFRRLRHRRHRKT